MRILITGGSGHLGSDFAEAAARAGHTVRLMSRRPAPGDPGTEWARADLDTGEGVAEAVTGIDVVVHAASDPRTAGRTDVEGTRTLVDAAQEAGVRHFVYVSIVGIDRIPFPYYRHKLAAEEIVRERGIPHSILRAAQFHYFVDMLLQQAARIPLVLLLPSRFCVQSVAIPEVSQRLLDVIAAGPEGMLADFVGPRAMSIREAARLWLRARRMNRMIIPLYVPGTVAAGFRAGHNTLPERPSGSVTWEDWLAKRYGAR